MKYITQRLRPIVYVLENFHLKFANLVALPTDRTMKPLVGCKVHLVLWQAAKNYRPNWSINGDAIRPQTPTKLTKNAFLNLELCSGAIWRHRESRNICSSTTFPHVHKSPKDVLENLLQSCMTFGAHEVVRSEPFLDYLYEVWHLLSALYSDMRKKLYIGAYLCSHP